MNIQFVKMQGLGNDFVVVDLINQNISLSSNQIQHIADRRLGIGCDQILTVEKSVSKDAQFRFRIYNADGSEAEQCGNGIRCVGKFLHHKHLTDEKKIKLATISGVYVLQFESDGHITVDMGQPIFEPSAIPFETPNVDTTYTLQVDTEKVTISALSMGNPHAVLFVEDIASAPVHRLGSKIESHTQFPQRVNVEFVQRINSSHVKVRVYERGVGETMACGSGACAAVVAGVERGLLHDEVTVELPGGQLLIRYSGREHPVVMTGPADVSFEGSIRL